VQIVGSCPSESAVGMALMAAQEVAEAEQLL